MPTPSWDRLDPGAPNAWGNSPVCGLGEIRHWGRPSTYTFFPIPQKLMGSERPVLGLALTCPIPDAPPALQGVHGLPVRTVLCGVTILYASFWAKQKREAQLARR